MMDKLRLTCANSERTGNSGLINSEKIKQSRKDLGCMSSLEELKSIKSYRI